MVMDLIVFGECLKSRLLELSLHKMAKLGRLSALVDAAGVVAEGY
jgi:hypothetical protein